MRSTSGLKLTYLIGLSSRHQLNHRLVHPPDVGGVAGAIVHQIAIIQTQGGVTPDARLNQSQARKREQRHTCGRNAMSAWSGDSMRLASIASAAPRLVEGPVKQQCAQR